MAPHEGHMISTDGVLSPIPEGGTVVMREVVNPFVITMCDTNHYDRISGTGIERSRGNCDTTHRSRRDSVGYGLFN